MRKQHNNRKEHYLLTGKGLKIDIVASEKTVYRMKKHIELLGIELTMIQVLDSENKSKRTIYVSEQNDKKSIEINNRGGDGTTDANSRVKKKHTVFAEKGKVNNKKSKKRIQQSVRIQKHPKGFRSNSEEI